MLTILLSLLAVAGIVLLVVLVVLALNGISWLKFTMKPVQPEKLDAAQRLEFIAPVAVDAVESRKLDQKVGKGEAAQVAAYAIINEYLAACGVSLPAETVKARIDAEVLRSYNAARVNHPQTGA